jgi:hypothetical protein
MDCHAGANAVPDPVHLYVGQQTTAVVENALRPDGIRMGVKARPNAELTQSPHSVAR